MCFSALSVIFIENRIVHPCSPSLFPPPFPPTLPPPTPSLPPPPPHSPPAPLHVCVNIDKLDARCISNKLDAKSSE